MSINLPITINQENVLFFLAGALLVCIVIVIPMLLHAYFNPVPKKEEDI